MINFSGELTYSLVAIRKLPTRISHGAELSSSSNFNIIWYDYLGRHFDFRIMNCKYPFQ